MRTLTALLALALVACGESGPTETPPEVLSLADAQLGIIAGADQRDTVLARLDPITVELRGGVEDVPYEGVVVNFVVTDDNCGSPFAGSAITDATGRASELWDLGTVARECTMEVRAVDVDGTPRVYASTTATVEPGAPAVGALIDVAAGTRTLEGFDSVHVSGGDFTVSDQHGNEIDAAGLLVEVLDGPAALRGGWLVPAGATGESTVRFSVDPWSADLVMAWCEVLSENGPVTAIAMSADGSPSQWCE